MKRFETHLRRLIWSLTLLFVAACSVHAESGSPSTSELRIGVLAYQDFESDRDYYDKLIKDISRSIKERFRFRLAIGTYAELRSWIENDLIDIAVVTPGIAADVLQAQPGSALSSWRYIASEIRSIPLAQRKAVESGVGYSSICLVPKNSALLTIDDIRRAAASGKAKFLAVDSYSISGFIAPMFALKTVGVPISNLSLQFTHSHDNTLRFLLSRDSSSSFGCVWRGALNDAEVASKFRILEFPQLDNLIIPPNAVLGKVGAEKIRVFAELLPKLRPEEFKVEAANAQYAAVNSWVKQLGASVPAASSEKVRLSEISATLLQYARTQQRPPRLAVVLAGGGAKCSYQVGAIRALEEELARVRAEFNIAALDISLIVGTSGGAINALPVALGITRTAEGQADFVAAWHDLDQREIISPSFLVRANISLWLASIELLLLLLVGYRSNSRTGLPVVLTMLLGAIQLALSTYAGKPWQLIGLNSTLHHTWLWLSWGLRGAGIVLIVVATLAAFSGLLSRYLVYNLVPRRSSALIMLLFVFVALPALQAWTMLWQRETFSEVTGIESSFMRNFTALINSEAKRRGKPQLNINHNSSLTEQLRQVSLQLKQLDLIDRDLVLTASPLADGNKSLPGDLYFYAKASDQSADPDFGSRGVSLDARPDIFFDALIGSGSIYPVFPPRTIVNLPTNGRSIDVVDGSFAHRSPLEAAVLWGATHIVLIEASTDEPTKRGNLLSNTVAALTYLYDEAQLTDVRAKEQLTVFSLVPEPPHIGLLDFSDNLIDLGITNGYREAKGDLIDGGDPVATFNKKVGKPSFEDFRG